MVQFGHTLGCIGFEGGKVFIGVTAVVCFFLVSFVSSLDVLHGTVILNLAVGLEHILVLASQLVLNLGGGHLVVEILGGLQIGGRDIGQLGIEHIKHKVRRGQYREIDNGRKDVLRLLKVNLVCYLHVAAILRGYSCVAGAPDAQWRWPAESQSSVGYRF